MEKSLGARDYLAAFCVVLIWGTNFLAMKFALRDLTPFQLGAGRYLFALLPLILFYRPPRLHWRFVLAYGLLQGVGQFGCLFLALKVGMSAALASVLLQTQLFFTALFSFIVLAEKPGKPLLAGLGLAALGLCCFAMNYLLPAAGAAAATTALGFALCLAAASMWAASNIVVRLVQKAAPEFDALGFLVWCSAVPVLPFVGLSLLFDAPGSRWQWIAAPWQGWVAVAYLGWIATIFGYTMWTSLIQRHGANRIAPFSLGVPVVGLSSGMLFLGEAITGWQWAGIALIVAALACVLLGGRLLRSG